MDTSGATAANAIPDTEPFAVRFDADLAGRRARRAWIQATVVAISALAMIAAGYLLPLGAEDRLALALTVLVFGGGLALLPATVALSQRRLARAGVVLAVNPAGIWIRARLGTGGAIWLPWDEIALVELRHLENLTVVTVKPKDRHAAGRKSPQRGYPLATRFADRSADEITAAITHFSAGRCPTTW